MVAAQSALRLRYDNLRYKTCLKTNHLTFNRERGEQQPITTCTCVRNCNISERFQLLKLNTIIFILQHVVAGNVSFFNSSIHLLFLKFICSILKYVFIRIKG